MAPRLIFDGPVTASEPGPAQIWHDPETGLAILFRGGTETERLTGAELGLDPNGVLFVAGTNELGPGSWHGTEPRQILTTWSGATVAFPDGVRWAQASVTVSQYGVIVAAAGHATREFIGAHTEVSGTQRWIIEADGTRILASKPGGCGCGGKKANT